jgi:uncharacterized protein (DUF1697 family)
MSIYISLLRGINVGGQKKLSMDVLRGIYQDLGFARSKTYLQSGTVVFESPATNPVALTGQVEAAIARASGYTVQVFIRRLQEYQRIVEKNPFLKDSSIDLSKLHVSFLYHLPSENAWSKVVTPANITDQFSRGETVIYLYYPNGYAKARIPASFFEKSLGVPLTDRNWNTVTAIYNIAAEMNSSLSESKLDAS